MPDYLHRKTVLDTIRRNSMLRVQDIYDAVESLPVTVVGHGRLLNPNPYGECSLCGNLMDIRDGYKYCPSCGAKMDGGQDE